MTYFTKYLQCDFALFTFFDQVLKVIFFQHGFTGPAKLFW